MWPLHSVRSMLVVGLLGMCLLPAHADPSIREQLRQCIQINGAVERLACFERLAQAELSRTPAPTDEEAQTADSDPRRIVSSIESIDQRPHGEYVFYLANGQTWTETQPGRLRYEPGSDVLIQRTFMGSWMMRIEGGRTVRVRRLD